MNDGKRYQAFLMSKVEQFVNELPRGQRGAIFADVAEMETGNFQRVRTKTLKSAVRELIVGDYRLIFFIRNNTIYITSIFRKKSRKTPKKEIEKALQLYKASHNQ